MSRQSSMPPPVRQIDPEATPEAVAKALLRRTDDDSDGAAVLRAAKRLNDTAQSAAV